MNRCESRQGELPLREICGWGGRRVSAGRRPGPRPCIRHRSRERLQPRFPCHVTLKVRPEVPSLRSRRLVRELETSFAELRERQREFRLVHYSIQGDHAHCLVEAKDRESLGRGMKALGARLARAVNRVFGRRGPVLSDRYHLQVLRSPKQVRNGVRYVLLNAAKHARRAAGGGRVDPASSGRWFDGWRLKLEGVPPPNGPVPVSQARTWLLSKGWRRHGLIDASGVPG